ncbi:MAG: TatD family hydrolase, partial [Candidatus Thorarchaeota archaeon]
MKVIDTHCHLEEDVFQEDLDNVVNKAMSKGIQIITSAINSNSWGRGQQIADQYENVHLSLGLDPTQYSSYSEALDKIRENKDRIVAVGEIGLDHYRVRDHSERELQAYAFRELALFAIASKLPVQIHSRSAGKAALEVLYGLDIGLVHMHAFDGKSSYARTASQEYGYYFSIPTSVVRSPQKKKLV